MSALSPVDDDVIRRHAETAQSIITVMHERLGSAYFTKGEDVGFELTPKLQTCVDYGGYRSWLEGGELIAGRFRGGRAEYAHITIEGEWLWTMMPLAASGVN